MRTTDIQRSATDLDQLAAAAGAAEIQAWRRGDTVTSARAKGVIDTLHWLRTLDATVPIAAAAVPRPRSAPLRVALIVGHCRSAPGARMLGFPEGSADGYEWGFNRKLRIEIIDQHLSGIEIIPFDRPETNNVAELCAQVNRAAPDVAIEMHFNASDGEGTGTEMLYFDGSALGKGVATLFQEMFVRTLGLRDRGVKPRRKSDRGGAFLSGVRCPAIIAEPFFGDNYNDCQRVYRDMKDISDAYVKGIASLPDILDPSE